MDRWSNGGTSIEMWAEEMANLFFLSDVVGGLDETTPDDWIALELDDWLPLIEQLDLLAELDDIIEANVSSIKNGKAGEIYNVGGGTRRKLADLLPIFEEICQKKVKVTYREDQKGDVRHTFADISKAERDLNHTPRTSLEDGLGEEWAWIRAIHRE